MPNEPAAVAARSLSTKPSSGTVSNRRICCGAWFASAVIACALSGCGVNLHLNSPSQRNRGFEAVGAESVQDQALAAISKSPVDFTSRLPAAHYSWERAQLFFREHTSSSQYIAGRSDTLILSNRLTQNDPMIFELERRIVHDGYRFILHCAPKTMNSNSHLVDISCRNVARFIKDGVLEESFLPTKASS